jgi:hypothetical protein
MIFDLEIQPQPVAARFINRGDNLPPYYIPALYINTNEQNVFPSDLVSIDANDRIDMAEQIPVTQIKSTESARFEVLSDRILLTNIAKYSKLTGSKYPIFFKHHIYIGDAKMIDKSIIIFNEDGAKLDEDFFTLDVGIDEAYVYINPLADTILFIEWATTEGVFREMIKLVPVFQNMGEYHNGSAPWETHNQNLNKYEFFIYINSGEFICQTTHSNSVLYYTSINNYGIIQGPIGKLDGQWTLLIENVNLKSRVSIDGDDVSLYYRLPEYTSQIQQDLSRIPADEYDSEYDPFFKRITKQLCKMYDGYYFKTQLTPAKDLLDDCYIYIYDIVTKELVAAYTSNKNKVNSSPGVGIIFGEIEDYSYDGIFKIGKYFSGNDYFANISYHIYNKFYEFRYLNMNSMRASKARQIALYLTPTYSDAADGDVSPSLYYVFIGGELEDDRTNEEKLKKWGASFNSKIEYQIFLQENYCMHLSYIAVDVDKMYDMLDIMHCGYYEKVIYDKDEITRTNLDVLVSEIINYDIPVQLNDTAVLCIDNNTFLPNSTEDNVNKNNEFLDFAYNKVIENIAISSKILKEQQVIDVVAAGSLINPDILLTESSDEIETETLEDILVG